jgi:hypothetical protein
MKSLIPSAWVGVDWAAEEPEEDVAPWEARDEETEEMELIG